MPRLTVAEWRRRAMNALDAKIEAEVALKRADSRWMRIFTRWQEEAAKAKPQEDVS